MKFEFSFETKTTASFRVAALKGLYDLSENKYTQEFSGDLEIENTPWNIGLIVGSSGSGKSSIVKNLFGEFTQFYWSFDSLIDDFDSEIDTKEIFETLSSVGFAAPPSWLKSFKVLSNGEKMRVELARALLSPADPIIFDEFTSVVDRHIAQVGSLAIQKAIRRKKKRFIAVSCHRDIVEWLSPDWIYDTDKKEFFFAKNLNDRSLILQSINAIDQYGASLANITI